MAPIDASRLRADLLRPAGPYAALDVVSVTGSTNADLRMAVTEGAEDRTVLIAEEQTAGSGRRGRVWNSPPGAGIYCSVLLRPRDVSFARLGSLSVVAGLAVTDVASALGVDAVLKWPNDVLAGPERGKCAGILSEAASSDEIAVVLGIGLNVRPSPVPVSPGPGGLPATSLREQGARTTDRTQIAALLLAALADREDSWRQARGDLAAAGLLQDYRDRCATLGQEVKAILADGGTLFGVAVDVDDAGQLILDTGGRRRTLYAGDVVHLRSPQQAS
ncbi:BirA family transcriptional regulator, biotin operon repressor / biotin-[acetyl-CoA-carboxylase] ligase [Amycolatopsis marina]|uniref:biotin--[biotin carboxyl-carrier protein] ligase n=1 Tax=Amycolatopsis marina TaxID=490629 RepID=A0A1I1A9S9_9PSEU|nr:biotin--[acetyl-CoA-carboxylase] ligase [Amycolatopsis marina]SFB34166.1 BirA family transcriptional regulator, biotin operon repressor / biotin-[acetyl-CoA-carboxylase] ligase [Amycolatopsis marina]